MSLIVGSRSIGGSQIGGRKLINDMLQFCAKHNIVAKTEVLPLGEVNAALDKVRNNSARYRMVLKVK
jgi:D-arabinose 1-dehydrogenase-like Zn-dependent alcohol dehydrogenase